MPEEHVVVSLTKTTLGISFSELLPLILPHGIFNVYCLSDSQVLPSKGLQVYVYCSTLVVLSLNSWRIHSHQQYHSLILLGCAFRYLSIWTPPAWVSCYSFSIHSSADFTVTSIKCRSSLDRGPLPGQSIPSTAFTFPIGVLRSSAVAFLHSLRWVWLSTEVYIVAVGRYGVVFVST